MSASGDEPTVRAEAEQLIQLALQQHRQGGLREAAELYRQVLVLVPRHGHALHLLGVTALQMGQPAEALELIDRAAEVITDDPSLHSNRGNALQALGRYEASADAYRRALTLDPHAAGTHANLGNALKLQQRPAEAVDEYRAALSLDANLVEVQRNLAATLLDMGKADQALETIRQALSLAPGFTEARLTLGNVLLALSRPEEAIACYQEVLAKRPGSAEVHCNLGNALRRAGKIEVARAEYHKSIAFDPGYAEARYCLAMAHQEMGEMMEATRELREALTIAPDLAKAWRGLTHLRRWSAEDAADIATMEVAFEKEDIGDNNRMELGFALGKCHHDLGQYDRAFHYYEIANSVHRHMIDYAFEQEATLYERIKTAFPSERFDQVDAPGGKDITPIFIIGMPRSGTTLVEQILASHAEVHGGGELNELPHAIARHLTMEAGVDYTASMRQASAGTLSAIAADYLAALRGISGDKRYVTDKLPMNFLNVGMIRLLFPGARIIHCHRSPLDTCLSIYRHYFTAQGHYYAYDLEELGKYYNLYRSLMVHWDHVLPGVIHEVEYETLVGNQEAVSRELIAACGLDWDPNCLEFHRTRRSVATLSASQVRRPIYGDSVDYWRDYEKHLGPLIRALESGDYNPASSSGSAPRNSR